MTATKIRQSEFAAKHKLLPGEVKAMREKHLTEGEDFWSEGRAIFWTEEAAGRVYQAIRPPTLEDVGGEIIETDFGTVAAIRHPLFEPETASIRIIKPARNTRFVYGELNGERVAVHAGKYAGNLIGKTVNARVITENGEKSYHYQP